MLWDDNRLNRKNFVVLDVASSRNVHLGYTLDDVNDEYHDRRVYVH